MTDTNQGDSRQHWHSMDTVAVAEAIRTNAQQGLSHTEAASRLEEYGPNTVTKARKKNLVLMFLSEFTNPLVVVLIFAAAITLLMKHYVDTGVILAVVVINAIIGFIQEERAESAIESLAKLLTVEATVIRDGKSVRIPSSEVVPGDVAILASGDKVPADIRLIQEKDLQVDESVLTGESAPVSKSSGPVAEDDPVSDRVCMAYSGTLTTSGSARGIVVATGDETELGLISGLISSAPQIATPLTRKLARFGKWLSAVVVGVALLIFGIGVAMGHAASEMFPAAVAIAVAAIPEGLPAIVTIVLAVGVKRMAERHAIIRNLPSVETLGSVTVIASDKTGTLTANEMTVSRMYAGGKNYEFTGVGYDPGQCCVIPTEADEAQLESPAFAETLRCGLLCNDSELRHEGDQWLPSGDPTEAALITSAAKAGLDAYEERHKYRRLDVIPFESAKMYMATLNASGDGKRIVYLKGSTERVLEMCSNLLTADGVGDLDSEAILHRAEDLARQGFRILSFARKVVSDGIDDIDDGDLTGLTYLGLQAISDPPRPEAVQAVHECKEAGIEVKMITGDHVTTAVAIAREVGIDPGHLRAVSGTELRQMSDEEFASAARDAGVFARVAPEQKYRLVEALQSHGHIVSMTGDGVNDAPALKKADIGVAMGRAGSDVARDASDMVLTDDNFASIVAAVEEGRTVFSNLIKTLNYILPTNVGEGLVIVAALLGGFALPVTPVQILWINTVTAVTLALPLAFEPKEPGLMKVPPRAPDAPLLSSAMLVRIALVSAVMVLGTFVIFWFEKQIGAAMAEAQTAAVSTIVAYEIFYLFSIRSEHLPPWKIKLVGNPYMWGGILLVILLQLGFTYIPAMNFFFGSTPLSWMVWWRILAISFPLILIVAADKAIRNLFGRPLQPQTPSS